MRAAWGHIQGWHLELFKHCLHHPIACLLWVQWRLREQHRMLVWLHPQFIVERVVPHLQSAEEEEVRETVCACMHNQTKCG